MKKLLIALTAIIFGGGFLGYLFYENGIRRAIEITGSDALGVPVTVTGVMISPFTGEGSIRGFNIANPEGFDAPYAIELGGLDIAVNVGSLLSDVIEIRSIQISDAEITYETKLLTDNIRTLVNNLTQYGSPSGAEANPDAASQNVIIRDLRMLNPQINLHTKIASAPIALGNIHLQNIGERSNAVTMAEAARQIISALNAAVISKGIPSMDVILDGARDQLQNQVRKVENAVEDIAEGVQSLFGR